MLHSWKKTIELLFSKQPLTLPSLCHKSVTTSQTDSYKVSNSTVKPNLCNCIKSKMTQSTEPPQQPHKQGTILSWTLCSGLQKERSFLWNMQSFLKYAKKFLRQGTLSKMYRGIVEPHFRYCCSVWGCCGKTQIDALQRLQNRAARIVTNSSYHVSATGLIKRLGWPTISDIILSETATIMFKSTNSLAPEYLSELFVKNSALNTMRLRNTEADLRVPLFKTANGQKSISFRGPKLWNQLSSDVRLAPSLSTFKRRLKDVVEG